MVGGTCSDVHGMEPWAAFAAICACNDCALDTMRMLLFHRPAASAQGGELVEGSQQQQEERADSSVTLDTSMDAHFSYIQQVSTPQELEQLLPKLQNVLYEVCTHAVTHHHHTTLQLCAPCLPDPVCAHTPHINMPSAPSTPPQPLHRMA